MTRYDARRYAQYHSCDSRCSDRFISGRLGCAVHHEQLPRPMPSSHCPTTSPFPRPVSTRSGSTTTSRGRFQSRRVAKLCTKAIDRVSLPFCLTRLFSSSSCGSCGCCAELDTSYHSPRQSDRLTHTGRRPFAEASYAECQSNGRLEGVLSESDTYFIIRPHGPVQTMQSRGKKSQQSTGVALLGWSKSLVARKHFTAGT